MTEEITNVWCRFCVLSVRTDINLDDIFQNSRAHPSSPQRNEEILEELKVEPVDEKLIRYK